jgi:antitoxin component YwqK of YwqJK toxin-antitoxin module
MSNTSAANLNDILVFIDTMPHLAKIARSIRKFMAKNNTAMAWACVAGSRSVLRNNGLQIQSEQVFRLSKNLGVTFHENGALFSQSHYKEGKVHGLAQSWYDDGQRLSTTTYVNGVREGLCTYWHANGKKKEQFISVNGTAEGEVKTWDEKGKSNARFMYKGKYTVERQKA